jgi:hypothetical protein
LVASNPTATPQGLPRRSIFFATVVTRPSEAASSAGRLLRPGGYTVCATEGAVTRCNGGATSADEAPLLQVTSADTNPGVSATVTLP